MVIDLAAAFPAMIERARLRAHCQSVENQILLNMTVDEVNALTRFLDGNSRMWVLRRKHNPAAAYIAGWVKKEIVAVMGRDAYRVTPLGEAVRRKLFGARMGGCGDWESGCDCKMCEGERNNDQTTLSGWRDTPPNETH